MIESLVGDTACVDIHDFCSGNAVCGNVIQTYNSDSTSAVMHNDSLKHGSGFSRTGMRTI